MSSASLPLLTPHHVRENRAVVLTPHHDHDRRSFQLSSPSPPPHRYRDLGYGLGPSPPYPKPKVPTRSSSDLPWRWTSHAAMNSGEKGIEKVATRRIGECFDRELDMANEVRFGREISHVWLAVELRSTGAGSERGIDSRRRGRTMRARPSARPRSMRNWRRLARRRPARLWAKLRGSLQNSHHTDTQIVRLYMP